MKSKIFIFIDAANVWSSQKRIGKLLDYKKISNFLAEKFKGDVEKIYYYEAFPNEKNRTYSTEPKHKFFTFLKKSLGFCVRKKELKRIQKIQDNGQQTSIEKGNMDVEIVIDVMDQREYFDVAVFFSGDSDFLPLVSFLRNKGKKVFVFSTKNTVSHELKTGANGYFDLQQCSEIHGKNLVFRNQKKPPQ